MECNMSIVRTKIIGKTNEPGRILQANGLPTDGTLRAPLAPKHIELNITSGLIDK